MVVTQKGILTLIFLTLFACILSGCSQNKEPSIAPVPDAPLNSSLSSPEQEPTEPSSLPMDIVDSALLNNRQYGFRDMYWLNNQELVVCQYNRDTSRDYRMVVYNVKDASEKVFFEWHSPEVRGGAFQTSDGFKIYADNRLRELDTNGSIVQENQFSSDTGGNYISSNGDYAMRIRNGGTYIVSGFTGAKLKAYDNTEKLYYHPIEWSHDGEYLALNKEVLQTITRPDAKPDSFFVSAGVVIVDKEGAPVGTIPLEWNNYYMEWLADTHEVALVRYPDTETPIGSLMVVDTDSGEQVGSYDFTDGESLFFNIGKKDCIFLVDAITYDENGVPMECDTYIYNYKSNEKEFSCKLYSCPGKILFSPDGQRVAMAAGYEHDIYISDYS